MRKSFPGHFQPNHDELDELLKSALISVDTNFLLNLYRFTPKAREHCFKILEIAKGRMWISHHVAQEYLGLYHSKIREQIKDYEQIRNQFETLPKQLDSLKEHPFVDHKGLIPTVEEYSTKILELIEKQAIDILGIGDVQKNFKEQAQKLHERIADLFEGRVGRSYGIAEQAAREKEIDERYKKNIPPGFLDSGKGNNRFGDALIWLQLLDHLNSFAEDKRPAGLIFVTNENDRDWWWLEDEQRIDTKLGPHHALISEVRANANVGFYLYSGPQFLKNMSRLYHIEVDEQTEVEIKSVSAEARAKIHTITPIREYEPREIPEILHDTLLNEIEAVARLVEEMTGIEIDLSRLRPSSFNKSLSDIWKAGLLKVEQFDDLSTRMRFAIYVLEEGGDAAELNDAIKYTKQVQSTLRLSLTRLSD